MYQENSGSGKARNNGIDVAKGKFIAFMDSDDKYSSSTTLESLYKKAVEYNADICGGQLGLITQNGELRINREFPFKKELETYNHFGIEGKISYRDFQYPYGYVAYIYSRDFLNLNNIRFPDYLRYQDPVFFAEAMVKARDSIYVISEETYYHRQGHKHMEYSFRQLNDTIKGITDNLILSKNERLKISGHPLRCSCVRREANCVPSVRRISVIQRRPLPRK